MLSLPCRIDDAHAPQLELQALHRLRQRLIVERTAVVKQMRALLLEHGIVVPTGRTLFAHRLPTILENVENGLSVHFRELTAWLRRRWLALDDELVNMTAEITQVADDSELCRYARTVLGVGPLISTAIVAVVGNGAAFDWARDMSAWLGLVPKQYSTGGKSNLGGISKRSNGYLRIMIIQGVRALLVHVKRDKSRMGLWFADLEKRSHPHVALIALANKIARICRNVLTTGSECQAFPRQPSVVGHFSDAKNIA